MTCEVKQNNKMYPNVKKKDEWDRHGRNDRVKRLRGGDEGKGSKELEALHVRDIMGERTLETR